MISQAELIETFAALRTIENYLEVHSQKCSDVYWVDEDGDYFEGDMGYFFEGMDNFKDYLSGKLEKGRVNEHDGGATDDRG